MLVRSVAAAVLLLSAAARAQSPTPGGTPPPPGMSLAQSAAMRFPQPVRVGDLPGRLVLQPVESQSLLGRVRSIVKASAGVKDSARSVLVVIELRRWFGATTRTIAVPVEAIVLLGDAVEVVAYTPEQLWSRPVFDPAGTTALAADATIKVGLAKPSH